MLQKYTFYTVQYLEKKVNTVWKHKSEHIYVVS